MDKDIILAGASGEFGSADEVLWVFIGIFALTILVAVIYDPTQVMKILQATGNAILAPDKAFNEGAVNLFVKILQDLYNAIVAPIKGALNTTTNDAKGAGTWVWNGAKWVWNGITGG